MTTLVQGFEAIGEAPLDTFHEFVRGCARLGETRVAQIVVLPVLLLLIAVMLGLRVVTFQPVRLK